MTDPRPAATEPAPVVRDAAAKPSAWSRLAENPLPSILAAVIVVLLGYNLTVTNDRISDTNDRISDTNDRISRLEDRMEARFAAQEAKIDALDAKIDALDDKVDAKFGELDAKIDDLNLKLTALIVALETSGAIDGIVEIQVTATQPTDYMSVANEGWGP